jgi:hypothetical protein
VAIALAGLVGGTIVATITRQQQFYRGASELLHVREGVRDAMEVLSTDVRGTSVADTVRLAADSAIEFFATIGGSVVCQIVANDVGLPVARSSGNTLTGFRNVPDTGDLALFHLDSAGANGRWERHRIAAFSERPLASSCSSSFGIVATVRSGPRSEGIRGDGHDAIGRRRQTRSCRPFYSTGAV